MIKKVEELIEENRNLIYKVASTYSSYYNLDDLFQVGTIGLIKAYKNYRMGSNAKFSTYAYKYILGEIVEFIKKDRNMKISSDISKVYKSYEKAKDFLTNEFNREVSFSEICSFMRIDEKYMLSVIENCAFTVSLDHASESEDFCLEKVVGTDERDKIDKLLDLKAELERLSLEEKRIIELRYYKDLTQSETAHELGLSQVQVSRNESAILKKMKERITA